MHVTNKNMSKNIYKTPSVLHIPCKTLRKISILHITYFRSLNLFDLAIENNNQLHYKGLKLKNQKLKERYLYILIKLK